MEITIIKVITLDEILELQSIQIETIEGTFKL